MRHSNMMYDVMVLNMEPQLIEISREQYGRTPEELSDAEAYYVVMELTKRIMEVCERNSGEKKVYYISTDFQPGKLLGQNLNNLGIYRRMQDLLIRYGHKLSALEETERELIYGAESPGIAAASLMDAATSLGYPVEAFAIRHGAGDGNEGIPGLGDSGSVEEASWDRQTNISFVIQIAGIKFRFETQELRVVGFQGGINKIRLFKLEDEVFSVIQGRKGSELNSIADKYGESELRRLLHQYFLAANSAQIILREMKTRKYDLRAFDDHATIQVCGANTALIIPELIRILVTDKAMHFMAAVGVVISACNYTLYESPAQERQIWPSEMLDAAIPRVMEIIRRLDRMVRTNYGDGDYGLQIIDRHGGVHMERICLHFTSSISYVTKTQERILSEGRLEPFAEAYPGRFALRGNGVSFNRWMGTCNRALTEWIGERIGEDYCLHPSVMEELLPYAEDEEAMRKLYETKEPARKNLAAYVYAKEGVRLIQNGVIDVLSGPIDEHAGHAHAIAYIERWICRILAGRVPARPVNFIFSGSPRPNDRYAAKVAGRLRELQESVNSDPRLSAHMRVVLLTGYDITYAQNLIPAADIAEITRKPEETSTGTTKIKFMLNGAVTLGKSGSCAEEIRELTGNDNIYMYVDERSYIEAKDQMLRDMEDHNAWAKKMLINIALSHHYSSAEAAERYNREVWRV